MDRILPDWNRASTSTRARTRSVTLREDATEGVTILEPSQKGHVLRFFLPHVLCLSSALTSLACLFLRSKHTVRFGPS